MKADVGQAVRLAGGDAKAGEVLVTAGTMLRPMHIAVIAAAGRGTVLVRPRPRVVVLSTGSELAEPGTPIIPGRIWDSNSFMIAAAAREAGCLAYRQAIVPDNPEQVLPAIEDQLARADLHDHHRRGQHGRRARRGQGGACGRSAPSSSARWRCSRGCRRGSGPWRCLPPRRRRARSPRRPAVPARGPRRGGGDPGPAGRARPGADLHPARQPGQRVRVIPDLRPARRSARCRPTTGWAWRRSGPR